MKSPPPPESATKKSASEAPTAYSAPGPKVSRQKKAKVLTSAERAAFLNSHPDLKPKS